MISYQAVGYPRPILLRKMAVNHFLGKFHALEFQQLHILIQPAIQRKSDCPGSGIDIRVFKRCFIHQGIGSEMCV